MNHFSSYPDQELLTRIKAGDERAYSELFTRYWQSLYEKAQYILDNSAAAKDIVQDVFFSIWARRAELEIQSVKGWLEQATRFQVFKLIRDRKAGEKLQQRLAEATADIMQDDPLLFREHQALLDHLISRLPEDYREVFRLSRKENLSYKEIAASLHISERSVKHRITQSLAFLRTHYTYEMALGLMITLSY